ncbi:unnamed protein product, partial [Sphagnum troendelagicum]
IQHNIAVAEYYCDGCSDPQKLLEVLVQVKHGHSEELAQETEEQQDDHSSSTSASPSLTGSDGSGRLPATSAMITPDVVASMGDHDSSIPTLNTAVMMYHLQQYADAMSVLEPLYSNVEPIDEIAALQMCLLMLDITLASHQPGKAAEVLQYMEKTFGYLLSPADSGNPAPVKEQLAMPAETESLPNSTEPILTRTFSEEALEEEALSLGELDIEPMDLKLVLHLYRACVFLLAGNLKASKQEIKSAQNLSQDHLPALLLKAHLRKEQTATLYFTKALHSFTCSHISQSQSVPKFSQDQSLATVYNASIQQLSWGNPKLAACCFQEAAALYYTWPPLWLCLAECCILALEKGLLAKSLPKREDVKREAIHAEAVTAAAAEEVKDNDGIKLKGSSHPFLLS